MGKLTKWETASSLARTAKDLGNTEAYNLALQAQWDFDFAMCADARGERSRAWAKRSAGNRALKKARELLGIGAPNATTP